MKLEIFKSNKEDGLEINLDTPIQYLKGVGPYFAKVFERRDIRRVGDLLDWYPRSYEDRRAARNIKSLQPNEVVSLKGQVQSVRSIPLGKTKRKIWDVAVRDATGVVHCKYFRVPYKGYFDRFEAGAPVRIIGKVTLYRNQIEFHHPDLRTVNEEEEIIDENKLIPLYTETENLSPQKLRNTIGLALTLIKGQIPEKIPAWIREKYQLPTREISLAAIHSPPQSAGSEFTDWRSPFHRRIIFEEFFWLELLLATRHSGAIREHSIPVTGDVRSVHVLKSELPFELTNAQLRTLNEIIADLQRPYPMHRLVQGDVGSGKTIVALLCCAYVMKAGFQCALMVPTEILAEQHFKTAERILGSKGFRGTLLTGQMGTKERKLAVEGLAAGDLQFVVGTHALIQEDVHFSKLAFVVIDEQHRFGVHQRHELKQKGLSPHFMVMTATPIPRTLAMTAYGDLDVSLINELPKGRTPIVTRVVNESKRDQVMDFIEKQISTGRQAYVIYPLVEESEKIDLKNAVDEYERLKGEFKNFKLGLLHGRLKSEEKELVMEQFRRNEIQLLVSTTVIEVGVDVPNANLILIEHAERFGLSQLHQLRGRVGRGSHKSFCILMSGYALSEEGRARLDIMAQTNDGFKIAEADLEIRGPGELLGSRQSGLLGFKMANLVRDVEILLLAREAAFRVVQEDPQLRRLENAELRKELERQHGPAALATVG